MTIEVALDYTDDYGVDHKSTREEICQIMRDFFHEAFFEKDDDTFYDYNEDRLWSDGGYKITPVSTRNDHAGDYIGFKIYQYQDNRVPADFISDLQEAVYPRYVWIF